MAKVIKRLYFDLPEFGRVHAMPGGELDVGGVRREAVISDVAVVGPSEEPVPAAATFKIAMTPGLSLKRLHNFTGNVTVQTDGGDTYLLREAWSVEPPKLSGGEVDMNINAVASEEVR